MKINSLYKSASKASIIGLLITASLVSCKKKQTEGPELNDLFGPFFIEDSLKVSANEANFQEGSLHFTAKTSIRTDFKLEVVGEVSGARFVLTGKAKELDINNAIWKGQATSFPSFASEPAKVMLTYPGKSQDTMFANINITKTKLHDTLLVESRVVSNFTNGRTALMPVIDRFPTSAPHSAFNSPVGNPYIYANGFLNATDGWGGGYYVPAKVMSTPSVEVGGRHFVNLPNRPNDVYFNIAVYNTGEISSFLIVALRQDDDLNGFDEKIDNYFTYFIRLENAPSLGWEVNTWRLFSIRYSDFTSGNINADGVHRPHRVAQVAFLHLAAASQPAGSTVSIAYDMPLFTIGRPYQP
jgi:hypothetical protein